MIYSYEGKPCSLYMCVCQISVQNQILFLVMVTKILPLDYLEKIWRRGNQNIRIGLYICLKPVWKKKKKSGQKCSVIRRIKCQHLKKVGVVLLLLEGISEWCYIENSDWILKSSCRLKYQRGGAFLSSNKQIHCH